MHQDVDPDLIRIMRQIFQNARNGAMSEQDFFQTRQFILDARNDDLARELTTVWMAGREKYWAGPVQHLMEDCIADACAFLNIDRATFHDHAAAWHRYVLRFRDFPDPEAFYKGFQGDMGCSNLCANILDQFSRVDIFALLETLPQGKFLTLADVGCGTAALSFPLATRYQHLHLIDLQNMAQEFIRWRTERCRHANVSAGVMADLDRPTDIMLCIDVLEHIARSSEFFGEMDRRIAPGGFLVLRVPWYSLSPHVEHLPEAEQDWFHNGGAALLSRRYLLLHPILFGGVYRKM